MNRLEYLIKSCNADAWAKLTWRMSIFNMARFPKDTPPELYDLNYLDDVAHFYNGSDWEKITDAPVNAPLFKTTDVFEVGEGDYPGLTSKIKTTAGRWTYNWIVFYFAFQDKFGYVDSTMSIKEWESLLYKMCTDTDDEVVEDEYKVVRPWQIGRYFQGHREIAPMCTGLAPTGTLRTLNTHPDWYKVRDALLVKHKDELDDVNVVLMIQAVGDKMDMEWLEKDQSAKFFNSKKARMRRRRLLVMHGIETAFEDPGSFTLVPKSLSESMDVEKLVAEFNATRMGSYGRGADTAKGGEAVRIVQMIFQNHQIVDGDCGGKITHEFVLGANMEHYIGMNIMDGGKIVQLDKTEYKARQGKVIKLRRPFLCQNGYIDTCSVCGTAQKAKEPRAIAADIASGESNVMLDSMGAMHGKEVEVVEYNPLIHIS